MLPGYAVIFKIIRGYEDTVTYIVQSQLLGNRGQEEATVKHRQTQTVLLK